MQVPTKAMHGVAHITSAFFLTCQGHIQEGISPSLVFVRGRVTKQAMLCWGQRMNTYMQATADQPATCTIAWCPC